MKNQKIVLLIISILIGLSLFPLFIIAEGESINSAIGVSATVLSGLATLITLIIALLLYNKYGIEETVLQKRTEAVIALLSELKKTRFVFESPDSNYYMIRIKWIEKNYFEEKYSEELVFSSNYYIGMEKLTALVDDLFLPKTIVEKYSNLQFIVMTNLKPEELKKYTKVDIAGYKNPDNIKYGFLNDKKMTLIDFITYITDLKSEAENWLKENSNKDVDLNY